MTLTYGLSSARDLFAKLQRDAAALDEEVTSDRFFNFVITGYSMIDWVKNDPLVPASAKAEVDSLRKDKWLETCGDIATASKHFTLTRRVPVTSSASAKQGFGVGRYGKGDHGVGEESIEVQLNDIRSIHCLDMVKGVIASWTKFFADHKI
jgi:hypothetical protein